jgi:GT2 family glycosyltransferase
VNVKDPSRSTDATDTGARLAVVLTCFNRKQKTLDCLNALISNTGLDDVKVSAVLVDDGSTDGTAEAVRQSFPWVQVVVSNGDLFWCRGMHKAFEIALHEDHDYYLWLNDDTMLHPDAVSRLLKCAIALRSEHGKSAIVVGSTVDAKTGSISYGGEVRASALRRIRFLRIVPNDVAQRCDSMTGNIVLIPREVAQIVGNLDPVFEHAMGDTDYALRARQLGFGVWVGPGVFGSCGHNPTSGTYMDADLPLSRRWNQMMSRKGLPWRSWFVYTRRHMGLLWPLYFVWPYLSLLVGGYKRRVQH